jgi:hypothetical protein
MEPVKETEEQKEKWARNQREMSWEPRFSKETLKKGMVNKH